MLALSMNSKGPERTASILAISGTLLCGVPQTLDLSCYSALTCKTIRYVEPLRLLVDHIFLIIVLVVVSLYHNDGYCSRHQLETDGASLVGFVDFQIYRTTQCEHCEAGWRWPEQASIETKLGSLLIQFHSHFNGLKWNLQNKIWWIWSKCWYGCVLQTLLQVFTQEGVVFSKTLKRLYIWWDTRVVYFSGKNLPLCTLVFVKYTALTHITRMIILFETADQ